MPAITEYTVCVKRQRVLVHSLKKIPELEVPIFNLIIYKRHSNFKRKLEFVINFNLSEFHRFISVELWIAISLKIAIRISCRS
jgi:hypothetical protein